MLKLQFNNKIIKTKSFLRTVVGLNLIWRKGCACCKTPFDCLEMSSNDNNGKFSCKAQF